MYIPADMIPGRSIWQMLLESAKYAPSPHNVQPWRVRPLDDAHAELLIEKRRTLPDEDVTGSFIVLSMGIFIEALSLAASHRGLALQADVVQPFDSYTADAVRACAEPMIPFARLTLRQAPGAVPEFSIELMKARRTSRLPYRPESVPAEAATRLASLAAASGQRYAQITEPAAIERLIALNLDAVFEDLNHAPYRNELRGWLRYSEREAARRRDGLDTRCMNVAPFELWSAFHASAVLRWPVLRGWFRRRYRAQIGPVATLGFLCGGFWDPADAYATGRFLLRFWLECTRLGLYIHPYGNLVTNRPVAARVEAETGLAGAWLVFKIGHSAPPPASRRRAVEEILID